MEILEAKVSAFDEVTTANNIKMIQMLERMRLLENEKKAAEARIKEVEDIFENTHKIKVRIEKSFVDCNLSYDDLMSVQGIIYSTIQKGFATVGEAERAIALYRRLDKIMNEANVKRAEWPEIKIMGQEPNSIKGTT